MTDDRETAAAPWRGAAVLALVFAVIACLAAADVALDLAEGTTVGHVVTEGAVVLLGLTGLAFMTSALMAARRQARARATALADLGRRLEATSAEAERWRREAGDLVRGLGAAIDAQFDRWQLTRAERDIAWLLLKGLSHKEIAAARGAGEATVRQQAQSLYRKAGLSGRNDLAAFFLEDLLPPTADR